MSNQKLIARLSDKLESNGNSQSRSNLMVPQNGGVDGDRLRKL